MEQFLGQILMVGFTFAPAGWALCNGQLLSISQNAALFSLLGTSYGGDGRNTFALPNLQGRVPIHQGQSPGTSTYVIGQSGGIENESLLVANLPAHTHSANANGGAGANPSPIGNVWAEANGGGKTPVVNPSYAPASTGQMASTAIGLTGSNQPFPVIQPYLTVNFIIALVGIFPSRG